MSINFAAVEARILRYNATNGRTHMAFKKVRDNYYTGQYSGGANLVIEFVKEFKRLPYGDNGMRLDKKADCSQFWINVLYYWFGIDHLGSYSESIYRASGLQFVSFAKLPPLGIVLYKLSRRNPHATHVAGKISDTEIGDTRSILRPFTIRPFKGWNESKITKFVSFVTPDELQSVTVQDKPIQGYPMLKRGDDGEYVKHAQHLLNFCGATLEEDGIFGSLTDKAVRLFQTKYNLEVDGIVGPKTWTKLILVCDWKE